MADRPDLAAYLKARDGQVYRGTFKTHGVLRSQYLCGQCRKPLKTIVDPDTGFWITVCAGNRDHPCDGFVTKAALEIQEHQEFVAAANINYEWEEAEIMLKDRHAPKTEDGGTPEVRVKNVVKAGRIALGYLEGNRPVAAAHFIFTPFTDDPERIDWIFEQLRTAMKPYGQEPESCTSFIAGLTSSEPEVYGSAQYKLRGSQNVIRCVGDGDIVHYKIGKGNRVEISDDEVVFTALEGGDEKWEVGQPVPCPGSSRKNRHPWCEGCRGELTVSMAIIGAEATGIWMLTTGDRKFYNQFWTMIETIEGYIDSEIVKSVVGVPLLFDRYMAEGTAPIKQEDGSVRIIKRERPMLNVQAHPYWVEAKMTERLAKMGLQKGPFGPVAALEAGPTKAPTGAGEDSPPVPRYHVYEPDQLPLYEDVRAEVKGATTWEPFYDLVRKYLRTRTFIFRDSAQVRKTIETLGESLGEGQITGENLWELLREYVQANTRPPVEGDEAEDQASESVEGESTIDAEYEVEDEAPF